MDWKRKLSSRKLWAAVAGVVITLLAVFGADELTTQQIIGVIGAVGTLISYIFGESVADAAHRVQPQETQKQPLEIEPILLATPNPDDDIKQLLTALSQKYGLEEK